MKTSLVRLQQCEQPSSLHHIRLCKLKKKAAYSGYIYRIVKEVPEDKSKHWAVDVIHSLHKPQLYGKVALEAARLSYYKRKLLLTSREVHTAVKVVLLVEALKGNMKEDSLTANGHVDST